MGGAGMVGAGMGGAGMKSSETARAVSVSTMRRCMNGVGTPWHSAGVGRDCVLSEGGGSRWMNNGRPSGLVAQLFEPGGISDVEPLMRDGVDDDLAVIASWVPWVRRSALILSSCARMASATTEPRDGGLEITAADRLLAVGSRPPSGRLPSAMRGVDGRLPAAMIKSMTESTDFEVPALDAAAKPLSVNGTPPPMIDATIASTSAHRARVFWTMESTSAQSTCIHRNSM